MRKSPCSVLSCTCNHPQDLTHRQHLCFRKRVSRHRACNGGQLCIVSVSFKLHLLPLDSEQVVSLRQKSGLAHLINNNV